MDMIAQPSPTTEPPASSVRPSLGRYLLRALLVLSLVYYAALMLDLVIHPLAPSAVAGTIADRFVEALTGTGVIVVGAFIMRRVPGNRVGPLLILYGVGVAGWSTRADLGSPLFTSIAHLLWEVYFTSVALPSLLILILSFPTGQIYPRWAARWITPYYLLMQIGGILALMSQPPGGAASISLPVNPFFVPALAPYNTLISNTLTGFSLLFLLGVVGVVISLILRYRAAHTRERQQIKWLIWMSSVTAVVGVLFFIFVTVAPNAVVSAIYSSPLGYAFVLLIYSLVNTFPVIGIGLAILRSRLWDIDIIINRTLVYGSLTALLVGLYVGLILAMQALVAAVTGSLSQQQPLVIVVSTLVIAALFQPLRRRLQNIIDRRFYRRKYDAAKIVAAFSSTLRQEVDLDTLREHLLAVVQETMQPSHVSLWLRKPEKTTNSPTWEGNRLSASHEPLLSSINQHQETTS